jgi:integral membrane protein
MNVRSPLSRLRLIGNLEGWSYLILLFVAMPLKYLAGEPGAVRVVGMIHGLLFIACGLALVHAHVVYKWTFTRSALIMGSTLVPFGTFIVDRRLLSRLTP